MFASPIKVDALKVPDPQRLVKFEVEIPKIV